MSTSPKESEGYLKESTRKFRVAFLVYVALLLKQYTMILIHCLQNFLISMKMIDQHDTETRICHAVKRIAGAAHREIQMNALSLTKI